ncbi:MAG: Gldg family protein [Proteobacteria bacterium]|nr:Gldg family protein [Pseudomonadota bacterium]MBU1738256.1 Gldg family protein [Pseudomonadota bacterium]
MNQIVAIIRKELKTYFGSPMAAIFIGAFLLSSFFLFFWVETFFARNIADIRPLFRWMPLLMIFLVAALTMRQWSEEQKMGTMEVLFTLPVRISQLVFGKFLAVLILVGISLSLTFCLPVTVSFLGEMDWGPVFGGYLAAMLMSSAYIAIGLYVSARTDSQIIALLLSTLLCGLFYLAGSSGITSLMGNETGDFFRALGTGSRFVSIERGVIDLRDLIYYCSLTAFFLALCVTALDRKGWSRGKSTAPYRRGMVIGVVLLAANLLALNIWLHKVHTLRLDLTEDREYSISETTRDLIAGLQEPLIMRGYFSEKTHPLLAPLVPRIMDMMAEYRVASGGRVEVSFVDPRFDSELEMEANQQYGIKPVPFQVAGRYEASVVNSYFNILIKYGDQYVTLEFNDLIEIQSRPGGQLDVGLRNLEYDLTKSIKKVVYGFQGLANLFENGDADLRLTLVVTPKLLPESLVEFHAMVREAATEIAGESGGKLALIEVDPDSGGDNRRAVMERFGIEPLSASLFATDTFFFHLMLSGGGHQERIYLAGDMGKAEIRKEIESSLKRTSAGFLKTVGVWQPAVPQDDPMAIYQQSPPQENYRLFQEVIRENYNLVKVDLTTGRVRGDVDVLLVIAPQELSEVERLAIDQYLMRGSSVIVLAGRYLLDIGPGSRGLNLRKTEKDLSAMLAHYGITVDDALVMDRQNEPFPVPVTRNLGGYTVQEIKQLDYPFFVDVRSDGMDQESPVTSRLQAVTMNWVSPLLINEEKSGGREVRKLLRSSPEAWLQESGDIQPDFARYPKLGFALGDDLGVRTLAVSMQGVFTSYFADREDPRLTAPAEEEGEAEENGNGNGNGDDESKGKLPREPIIKKSAESARLVVVGSAEFINDTVLGISQSMGQERFLNSLEFLQNLVDWSVADDDLLAIRSRGAHARLLVPMSRKGHAFWEWLNYLLGLLILAGVSGYGAVLARREEPMELE